MDDILNTAPCGFLSFADDGLVTEANATLLDMLGYARDEVVGQHVEHLLTVGTRIFYQTHWFPLLSLHGHAEEVFLLMRTKAGASVGMLSYARRRPSANLYDCVVVQVRERAKYEDELLRARRAADRANQAKSSFLAMMSHELRTPLNAIGGYLQILELGIPGPMNQAQRDIIGRLDQSSQHLLRLINEVLDLARVESGQVTYDISETSAADLLAHVLPMIEPQLADKGLHFSFDVARELVVRADVEKAQQILLNLLGNAVKFTPAGGSVSVIGRRENGSVHDVHVEVRDNGIGIPDDQLEAVFEPFVQVEGSAARGGSGLGLAISRDLARGMGGDLFAESTLGAGSTFTLRLPAAHTD